MIMSKKQAMDGRSKKTAADPLLWDFPSTNHGEEQGFSDSLLEPFQGDHEKYIARETIQNAVDARLDYAKPVTVIFERLACPVSALPGHMMLLDRVRRCREFVSGQVKAEKFFQNAIRLLEGGKLQVLKISDYNTKGLSGSDEDRDGNWYRLVRVTGTSSAKGVEGGSFGIGKGAPIAASSLRTVFYSSIDDKGRAVFQGKARLVSHYDKDHDVRRGVGLYGVDGYKAVRDADAIPDFFRRKERGTDIFVMGYRSNADWQQKIIRSVLENFWLAILSGGLEVIVKDVKLNTINKNTLREMLEEYEAERAKFFYESVTNPTQEFTEDLKNLGKVSLFVRKQDGFPNKIMMVRKPKMLVEERRSWVLREPHAGVCICDDDRGNSLLKELEPPAHDKWDRGRAPDVENGLVALQELDAFIRRSLKSLGEAVTSEPQDIPGLDRYLPDSEDRDYASQVGAEPLDTTELFSEEETGREIGSMKEPTAAEVETVLRHATVVKSPATGIGVGRGGANESSGGDRPGTSGGEEPGAGDSERIRTADIRFRSFVQKAKDGFEYHFVITGREDCRGAIRLIAVGDDGSYPVEIESAKDATAGRRYDVSGPMIKGISVESGKTARLAVKLSSKKKYALGIETYEG